MSIAFYDATVTTYLQTLRAASGFLHKGLSYCEEQQIDPDTLVEARLHADMLPLRFQVQCIAHHSAGALAAFASGEFRPPQDLPQSDYRGLQQLLTATIAELEALDPARVNTWGEGAVAFRYAEMELPFTAQNFLLSFSLPNFYFHATTAYDILRTEGVPLGKRDYLGALRLSPAAS